MLAIPATAACSAPDALTLGIFLPLRFMKETCACWLASPASSATYRRPRLRRRLGPRHPAVRPRAGDAGQLFDPFTYLAYPAARTQRISLATGSAIFSLRHPIDLAKSAATIDQPPAAARHGHRLRRPSHRVPRLRPATRPARRALRPGGGRLPPPAPTRLSRPDLAARPHHRRRTPAQAPPPAPSPARHRASGQSPDWIAAHADGWLTYPGSSVVPAGPKVLGQKIQAWRDCIPDGGFRPHATNEWIDLVDDPAHPPTLLHGGAILQIGRHALIDLLTMADCRRQPRRPGHSVRAAPPPKPSRNWRRKCCRASRRMRMCRHWIWIGRRDCESSANCYTHERRTAGHAARQHSPPAGKARPPQPTPPRRKPPRMQKPPARPVSAGDVSLATDHGSSNATSLESRSPRRAARLRATPMRLRESEGSRRRRQRG